MAGAAEIRTYKTRRGRVTAGQAAALAELGGRYLVPADNSLLDLPATFGREAPVVLEIGFGMGEATAELAAAEPDVDVLAVDVHTPGVGALLRRLESAGLDNVRVVEGDAIALLRRRVPADALAGLRVFFPDPWPKTRHAKRRLVTSSFCDLVASRLRAGGFLHVVTDDASYADQARSVIAAHDRLTLIEGRPFPRATTRFERQARAADRAVVELCASRD
jgi:tRNA (guanine-N7-)-methyltransferase